MKLNRLRTACLAVCLFASPVLSAPLDDAKALLEQKKFDEVDKALMQELSQKAPSTDALRISYEAARLSGHLVTAERRMVSLLKATQNADADLLLSGAQLAELNADARGALTRYLAYTRLKNEKTDQLEKALVYVLKRDAFTDEYKKYIQLFGATERGWELGTVVLAKLIDVPDPGRALDLAGFLLNTYPAVDNVNWVQQTLWAAQSSISLGKDPTDRYLKPFQVISKSTPSNFSWLSAFMDGAAALLDENTRATFVTDVMNRSTGPITNDVLSKFASARSMPDENRRLELGKLFLAAEPKYRDHKEAIYAENYLRMIVDSPQVFAIAGKQLLTGPEVQARLEALMTREPTQASRLFSQFVDSLAAFFGTDNAARIAFLQKHLANLNYVQVQGLLDLTQNADAANVITQSLANKSFRQRVESEYQLMPRYSALKLKDQLVSASKMHMLASPANFNWQHVKAYLVNPDVATADERLAALEEVTTKIGAPKPMVDMATDMLTVDANKWAENPRFVAWKARVDSKPAPADPLVALYYEMATLGEVPASGNPAALAAAQKFLAAYAGPIPNSIDDAKDLNQYYAYLVLMGHWNNVRDNGPAATAFMDTWLDRLPPGALMEGIIRRLRETQQLDYLFTLGPKYIAKLTDQNPGTPQTLVEFASARAPSAEAMVQTYGPLYAKFGNAAMALLFNARDEAFREKKPLLLEEMAKVAALPGYAISDRSWGATLIHHGLHWSNATTPIPLPLIKTFQNYWWTMADRDNYLEPTTEAYLIGYYVRSGYVTELGQVMQELSTRLNTKPIDWRINVLISIFRHIGLPAEPEKNLVSGYRNHTLLKLVKPLIDQIPPAQLERYFTAGQFVYAVALTYSELLEGADKAEALTLAYKVGDMLIAGAPTDGPTGWHVTLFRVLFNDALARGDMPAISKYSTQVGSYIGRDSDWAAWYRDWINPITLQLEEKGNAEQVFEFLSAVERQKPPETEAKQIAIAKSRNSAKIPNMVPVAESDPTYKLYVAANAYTLGDEGTAWEMTNPMIDLLIKNWETLDIKYVAWTVDQIRKQKGAMLKTALEFAQAVLLREADLDPEIAAKLLLTRGDIYRDVENYQAARIEYESLRNNSRYNKTEAGSNAVYRLVTLLIVTKDYATAQGMLERMIDADSIEVQTEAYYLLAKMSFQREEFQVAWDYLKEVRNRSSNHVESAFLEGELNIVMQKYNSPEVKIGDLKMATTLIPGRQLTLTQKDPNLSIARGGSAIPVIVTTSKGGDEEHVKLLPSSTDKNLFVGTIGTSLGKAAKNNVNLEINGEDTVSYIIDPEFQKANDLSYPEKILEVKYDARLVASSGEILTEEEEEKRAMQRQLERAREFESRRTDVGRDGRTIRPGSPIYCQITDFDQDISDEADKVSIDLRTTSGDVLEGFVLTETGPHTGMFRGQVPTGIPLPKATASDSDANTPPSGVINSTKPGIWTSADSTKPKWFNVDTMSSYEVKSISGEIPNLSSVRDLVIQGALAQDDFEEIASYPARDMEQKGGMIVDVALEQSGDQPDQIQRHVRKATVQTYQQDKTEYALADSSLKGRNHAWVNARLRGKFYLSENKSLELKFMQGVSPNNWQRIWLFIDGRMVLGGLINDQTINLVTKVDLSKGTHSLEVLVMDAWDESQVIIGARKDDGTWEAMPADWFSIAAHPELADALRPKGELKLDGDVFTATLTETRRFRNIRVLFRDFTGTSVSVKSLTVVDTAGATIIPVKEDFTSSASNQSLEISPGDEIQVAYLDKKRTREQTPTLTANLNSSFFNATIMLGNEVFSENERNERFVNYYPAKRTRIGDSVAVVVADYDMDTTDDRDVVDVVVSTSAGEKTTIKLLETQPNYNEEWHKHAGMFIGILKIGQDSGADTIKVGEGDDLTVTYLDKENTNPGVPIERTYSIYEAGKSKPDITVYHTDSMQVVDTSEEAKAKMRRIQTRDRKAEVVIYKDQVVATHPFYKDATTPAAQGPSTTQPADAIVSVTAPLIFEINYTKMALNSASICEVNAVADSELKAAEKEGRQPTVLKVPTYLYNVEWLASVKGYPIQLRSQIRRSNEEMLRDGVFAGVVRLQVGKPGDPVDDLVVAGEKQFVTQQQRESQVGTFAYRVPTLVVAGNDLVHIQVTNEKGEILSASKIRLLSDARLELLDAAYIAQADAIHLGERFYVKVTDPDQDISNERDTVTVSAQAASGDKVTLKLTETLEHSGVFTGQIIPSFIGEKVNDKLPDPNLTDDQLSVTFGDEVNFTFVDSLSLKSSAAMEVATKGKVFMGADGELAVFSKQFKDPEIAVKTRFLMAEALFEMAKEYRKLNQIPQADESISRGKFILDEALRDYPDTTYAVQGEYLLANLAQELSQFQEAIGRYSHVISAWPDSEYAGQSQFKKAVCFEKMKNYDAACEEYVRLTYVYPADPLVADATVRLGNYYYQKQSFAIAAKIFFNFQQKNPQHPLAAKALFLAAQCSYKQEAWADAIKKFQMVVDEYVDDKETRAEAMYWLGDSMFKSRENVRAYQIFKKLTWDYPESKWAKIARGRLTEEVFGNMKDEQ